MGARRRQEPRCYELLALGTALAILPLPSSSFKTEVHYDAHVDSATGSSEGLSATGASILGTKSGEASSSHAVDPYRSHSNDNMLQTPGQYPSEEDSSVTEWVMEEDRPHRGGRQISSGSSFAAEDGLEKKWGEEGSREAGTSAGSLADVNGSNVGNILGHPLVMFWITYGAIFSGFLYMFRGIRREFSRAGRKARAAQRRSRNRRTPLRLLAFIDPSATSDADFKEDVKPWSQEV